MVLDEQVTFLGRQSFLASGDWFKRRWLATQKQEATAMAELNKTGIALDVLRAEWALQVQTQTKPLPSTHLVT